MFEWAAKDWVIICILLYDTFLLWYISIRLNKKICLTNRILKYYTKQLSLEKQVVDKIADNLNGFRREVRK